jgi:magnesium-transporting ATPase (P-type)
MIQQVLLSGLLIGTVGFGFFKWALDHGWTEFEARNTLLLLMVLFENVHVFNCRSETRSAFRVPFTANPFLIVAVVVAQCVHIGAMYVPGLSDVLGIAPISADAWIRILPIAFTLLAVMEIYKVAIKRAARPGERPK